MYIIGNGQLANAFTGVCIPNVVLFASGVSASNCIDRKEFLREESLLREKLLKNRNKKFVYFSSCALSAENYKFNDYYIHKQNMENLIQNNSNNYYIFRIPQLFGSLIHHKTLINFIYESIVNEDEFFVFHEAYRYVIEIGDARKIVEQYLLLDKNNVVVDIANPYRYKVIEIVKIFEKLLNKKAHYEIVQREDKYTLDLSQMQIFIKKHKLNLEFGENYLINKLKEKLS